MSSIDLTLYRPGDPRFAAPYIEVDEHREAPLPHRHVHGGFEGTDTSVVCHEHGTVLT